MRNILFFSLILLTITLTACSDTTAAAIEVDHTPVETKSSEVVAEGKLLPAPSVELAFVQPGIVAEVLVAPGDPVTQGDVIVRLVGIDTIQAELESARFEMAAAQYALDALYKDTNLIAAQALKAKDVYEQDLEDLLNPELQQALVLESIADAKKAIDDAERRLRNYHHTAPQADIDQAYANMVLAEDELEEAEDNYEDIGKNKQYKNVEVWAAYFSAKAQAQKDYDAAVRHYNSLTGSGDEIDIAVAEADLAKASAQLIDAQREWERIKEYPNQADVALLEAQIADADQDYETYKNGPDPDDVSLAEARLENAQAQIRSAEEALANLELRAPFDGSLLSLSDLTVGQAVNPSIPVAFLGDTTRWQVETTDLAEIDIANVGIDKLATIKLDAFPSEEFSAKVVEIDTVGREHLGDMTYKVTLELDQNDPRFMWKMTATVMIELD